MPRPRRDQVRRAAKHAALGEPLRLAIVEDLLHSDRSPGELASAFRSATNLVAHHLDVLADAGLIERFTSSADKRRRYVRATPAAQEMLGLGSSTTTRTAGRVLFVCTANSARSQLAAALWRARTGGEADSAGTEPAEAVHPGAVAAARRAGLDLSTAVPRALHLDEEIDVDVVVTVCDRAHEDLAPGPAWWHWSTPDPVRATDTVEAGAGSDLFDLALAQLDARICTLTRPNPQEAPS